MLSLGAASFVPYPQTRLEESQLSHRLMRHWYGAAVQSRLTKTTKARVALPVRMQLRFLGLLFSM